MIVKIPQQRKHKHKGVKRFKDLVNYSVDLLKQLQKKEHDFENIINYETATVNKNMEPKCVAVRTHGITKIENASAEMDAVASQNTRCKDPAYHFILAWPDFERPAFDKVFEAAEHAIRSLGLGDHQYVLAVHTDTDNLHCHIAVNRVNPHTFKSKNIEWSVKTLHMAARQSEIKHGWFHDNGYYIVQKNEQGKKTIILNPKFVETDSGHGISPYIEEESTLPSWHDPESLESWLKSFVSAGLKRDIKNMKSWYGLHAWLAQYDIRLANTGGGMRLMVSSADTGEILEVAASRGLRMLKKAELEERWGKFLTIDETNFSEHIPDFSKFSKKTLNKGVENVLRQSPDYGNPPPPHILNIARNRQDPLAKDPRSMRNMPVGGLDGGWRGTEVMVQNHVLDGLDFEKTGKDRDVRWPRNGEERNGSRVKDSKREERKKYRAAQRADLRRRFAQYRRYTRDIDTRYWQKLKDIKTTRRLAMQALQQEKREAISAINPQYSKGLNEAGLIAALYSGKKLQIEEDFQKELRRLNEVRMPPLGWRVWLHEQAQLGDQAALSALRGIVYQAKRDAKYAEETFSHDPNFIDNTNEIQEGDVYFKRLMKRLFEEEQQEVAIRAARSEMMRPHEVDAVIAQYKNITWHVTGNGNIEYSQNNGEFLFTDRGNRVTFDRELVSDDDIKLALLHASRKFGNQIVLTGSDPTFTRRMAELALELGIKVINPELQDIVHEIKAEKTQAVMQEIVDVTVPEVNFDSLKDFAETIIDKQPEAKLLDPVENLKYKVLSVVPNAQFEIADKNLNQRYTGKVYFKLDDNSGFVQHNGRDKFIIHMTHLPYEEQVSVDIQYKNKEAIIIKLKSVDKDI